jgi:hypothetical protein
MLSSDFVRVSYHKDKLNINQLHNILLPMLLRVYVSTLLNHVILRETLILQKNTTLVSSVLKVDIEIMRDRS